MLVFRIPKVLLKDQPHCIKVLCLFWTAFLFDTSCYLDLIVPRHIFFLQSICFWTILAVHGEKEQAMEPQGSPSLPPGGDRLSGATILGKSSYRSNNGVMEIKEERKKQCRQSTFQLAFSVVEVFYVRVNSARERWFSLIGRNRFKKIGQ